MSAQQGKYTCQDYRKEMVLLSLKKRLLEEELSEDERAFLVQSIEDMEKEIGLD